MNKAFTKEADFDPMAELIIRPLPVLPPGVLNYITPAGAAAMIEELRELERERRPVILAELTSRVEAGQQEEKEHGMLRARLYQLEEQIRFLKGRVGSFEVVPSRDAVDGPIRFGDRVVVMDPDGEEHSYTIVGADEADAGAQPREFAACQAVEGPTRYGNAPTRRPTRAVEEREERSLARAARAHQGHRFTLGDAEVDIAQRGLPAMLVIGERNTREVEV